MTFEVLLNSCKIRTARSTFRPLFILTKMSESEESVIPSTMNLTDLMEMATSPTITEEAGVSSSKQFDLTDAKALTSVPHPASGLSYDLQINYNEDLAQRIETLATTKMLSDVTLLVGEEKAEIKAHKLILALSSPVFTSMFYSPLLESRNIIEIPDCKFDAFLPFIQFLYRGHNVTSRLPVPTNNDPVPFILGILYAARKYAVKGLEDACAVTLSTALNAANVFEILNASNLHSMPILDSECWEFIEENTEAVLDQSVQNLDLDTFSVILKNEHLNIKEVKLFEFVMRWIDYECGEQQLIPTRDNKLIVGSKLLALIRFPAMPPTEFCDVVVPTGILSVEQVAKVLTYISASPENKSLYVMEFPVDKREPKARFQFHSPITVPPGSAFVMFDVGQRDGNANENNTPVSVDTEDELRPSRSRRNRRSRRRNSTRFTLSTDEP